MNPDPSGIVRWRWYNISRWEGTTIPVKITELEELRRKLRSGASGARAVDGPHDVPFTDLEPPLHVAIWDFSSIGEMVASGFQVRSIDDFKRIPDIEWDAFVASRTRFGASKQMLTASAEYLQKKVGL